MAKIININDSDFSKQFADIINQDSEHVSKTQEIVRDILNDVRINGDEALLHYTHKFDSLACEDADDLRILEQDINTAFEQTDEETKEALFLAAERIRSYHEHIMPEDVEYNDASGVKLGNRWLPVNTVGIYVPGGLASYPSSVLMNAIPAQVAGVKNIIMVVPAPEGKLNPLVLAAAHIAGVKDIFTLGGAQAVGALTYGTKTIPAVDVIVGPGNEFVAEAKRQVFGKVGIDMVAGPSEILVISDDSTNPKWLAADLLSQAEHDKNARSILITDSQIQAENVLKAVEQQLVTSKRESIARESWENNGAIIVVNKLSESIDLANRIAPEHLEICTDNPESIGKYITTAGAIFLGRYTPEAIGDYTAGPSHVLPTSGTARFSSGLSVYDFMRRVSVIGCTKESFSKLCDATYHLAEMEGLEAHAISTKIRKEDI